MPPNSKAIALEVTEMPRLRSISIQSLVAARCALRDLTAPAAWIAPPYSNSFSVSVVLPASGCEMIAKVRRRCDSWAMAGRKLVQVGPERKGRDATSTFHDAAF